MNDADIGIVGGKFGLPGTFATAGPSLPVLKAQRICMLSGRCCLGLLADRLRLRRVWMPSYPCPTMLDPFAGRTCEIRFYEVDERLCIAHSGWLREVGQGDLVIFIDYFGFPHPREHLARAAERGAWVLEDAAQALLTEGIGQHAHFLLLSPRKFVGVPDGGILTCDDGIDLGAVALEKPPTEWWMRALEATLLRREWDRYGQDYRWFPLIQEAEATIPLGHYAMSELTQVLCFHGFDYPAIAARRIANYTFLLARLPSVAFFADLPAGVVPQGFPIRVEARDTVRRALFDSKIYPPIHWRLGDTVPSKFSGSHRLSAEILTLPCDQRYDTSDMERVAEVTRKALGL